MNEILEYNCPNCGGKLEFDSGTQKMVCPYCDSTFEPEQVKQHEEFMDRQESEKFEAYDTTAENGELAEYICNNCGAEVICAPTTAATICPYCDSPLVMSNRVSGILRPEFVIPFALDKNAAIQAMKKELKWKWLVPKQFKQARNLDQFEGMYIPFWLYDCTADANVRFDATKKRSWVSGDYRYTETKHYAVYRDGTLGFDLVPVDGFKQAEDNYTEALEPYDYSKLTPFSPSYLAGFTADRYDVDSAEAAPRAADRIKNSVVDEFRSTVNGYSTCTLDHIDIRYQDQKVHYALFPVWRLNTTYNGKEYRFAMNGQTGKFVGQFPMSMGKFFLTVLLSMIPMVPLAYGLIQLFYAMFM